MSTYRAHQDKKGITTGVVSWLTALAVTLSLLIGASSAGAMGRVQFLEHLSSKDATRLLENIEWNRYQTIQINIAQVNLTELEGSGLPRERPTMIPRTMVKFESSEMYYYQASLPTLVL